ncbi:hypothetical protein [Actinophytocola sediminis]
MRPLLALLTAALLTGLAVPAKAAPAGSGGLPDLLRPAVANLFPEGVAYDPSRRALLVGSVGTVAGGRPAVISAVGRDDVARPVVSDAEIPTFLGLKVDAVHHRIVAVYGSQDPAVSGGLAVYDLRTGARLSKTELPGAPNDVTVDRHGTAYVSDTNGAIHRVTLAGTASTVISDPRLGPTLGANGIAWHPRGYLLVAHYQTGQLFRVDGIDNTASLRELRLAEPLIGADGIALRPNGTLVVVTNSLLPQPGARVAVHELVVGDRYARPFRVTDWPDPAPTTVAVTPFGDYVLDGHFDVLLAGGTASDFVLRRR